MSQGAQIDLNSHDIIKAVAVDISDCNGPAGPRAGLIAFEHQSRASVTIRIHPELGRIPFVNNIVDHARYNNQLLFNVLDLRPGLEA